MSYDVVSKLMVNISLLSQLDTMMRVPLVLAYRKFLMEEEDQHHAQKI
jgi:hypothetical protein